jgi:ribosomal protein L7Ae-like RNA K-turn-binding protein
MRKAVVSILLPSVVALAAFACSTRAIRNPPPRSDQSEEAKADLGANDAGKSTGHSDGYVDENKINQGEHETQQALTPPPIETRPDLEITHDVRRALAADASLSAKAKQVKIVTANGVVTLGGAVGSETERRTVASTAQRIAGVTGVNNRTVVVR